MKSKTSFFNGAVLKKDCTRFAPVWILYLIGLFMVVAMPLYQPFYVTDGVVSGQFTMAQNLGHSIQPLVLVNAGYALVCAQALFGDLFSTRMGYALHAMPLRREGWFFTHTTAGLLFSLAPNLLCGALCIPALGSYWYTAFVWMAGMALQFLFFFGLAVFCTMCTGNRIGMAIVYGILNFLAVLGYAFWENLYTPLLYGVVGNAAGIMPLSPVVSILSQGGNLFCFLDKATREGWFVQGGWRYLTILAAVGLGLLGAALALYRRRKLECAGDLLALRPLGKVFLLVYTLCAGLLSWGVGEVFLDGTGQYLFLILGLAVGFFTGQMLLCRRVKVFTLLNFLGWGALVCGLFLSFFLTAKDPLGVSRYVPRAEQIASVSVSGEMYFRSLTLEDPAEFEDFARFHRVILEEGAVEDSDALCLITYTLKSGRQVSRRYPVSRESQAGTLLADYLSRPEYVLDYTDWGEFLQSIYCIRLEDDQQIQGRDARELAQALRADCEAGRLTQPWWLRAEEDDCVSFSLSIQRQETRDRRNAVYITIHSGCTETIQWLTVHRYENIFRMYEHVG